MPRKRCGAAGIAFESLGTASHSYRTWCKGCVISVRHGKRYKRLLKRLGNGVGVEGCS